MVAGRELPGSVPIKNNTQWNMDSCSTRRTIVRSVRKNKFITEQCRTVRSYKY